MKRHATYWLRQLLPRTYSTTVDHIDDSGIHSYLVIWRMWLGRCYDVTRVQVPAQH
jgi:hypothetical protein